MAREETQEGLVLKSLNYKDRQRIITLFTPRSGIVSLIVKGLSKRKPHLFTLTTPLVHSEFHYRIGQGDLYRFRDGTPFRTHDSIKEKLTTLFSASKMLNVLLQTQMPGKSAPQLFCLTLAYLKAIPSFKDPRNLKASFLLKLLKHDGLLDLNRTCSLCQKNSSHLYRGEFFCEQHVPHSFCKSDPNEWKTLQTLTHARGFSTLQEINLSETLEEKIIQLFYKQTNH